MRLALPRTSVDKSNTRHAENTKHSAYAGAAMQVHYLTGNPKLAEEPGDGLMLAKAVAAVADWCHRCQPGPTVAQVQTSKRGTVSVFSVRRHRLQATYSTARPTVGHLHFGVQPQNRGSP